MAIILYEKESKAMVNYNDLRKAYTQFIDERAIYRDDLNNKILDIFTGFAKHLGISDKTYTDNDGNAIYYLQLGTYNDSVFTGQYGGFNINDLTIDFAFKLTIDRNDGYFPKENVITKLSITKKNSRYIISSNNNDTNLHFEVSTDEGKVELYNSITNDILKTIDINQFK